MGQNIFGFMSKRIMLYVGFRIHRSTQRLAQGRAWALPGRRENSKRGKCSKMHQNPQSPVHTVLACFSNSENTFPA